MDKISKTCFYILKGGEGRNAAGYSLLRSLTEEQEEDVEAIREECVPSPKLDSHCNTPDAANKRAKFRDKLRPASRDYTLAEISLPWRRREAMHAKLKKQNSKGGWWYTRLNETEPGGSPSGKRNKDGAEVGRVTTPTALEQMLPWKREDEDSALKQSEFPPWCSNKDYLAYNSPSNTFLGGILEATRRSVIGLFRRESGSGESLSQPVPLYEQQPLQTQPQETAKEQPSRSQQPQRRHKVFNRRGSLLEFTTDPIQEEKIDIGEGTSSGSRGKWGKSWGRGVRQHSLPAGCAIDSAGSTPPSSPEPEDKLMKFPLPRRQASRSESEVIRRTSDPKYIELKHQDSSRSTQSTDLRYDQSKSVDFRYQSELQNRPDYRQQSRSSEISHQDSRNSDSNRPESRSDLRQDSRSSLQNPKPESRQDSKSSDRQDSRSSDQDPKSPELPSKNDKNT